MTSTSSAPAGGSSAATAAELATARLGQHPELADQLGAIAAAAVLADQFGADRYQSSRRSIEHPMMRAFAEIKTTSSLRSKSSSAGIMLHEWHIGTM